MKYDVIVYKSKKYLNKMWVGKTIHFIKDNKKIYKANYFWALSQSQNKVQLNYLRIILSKSSVSALKCNRNN